MPLQVHEISIAQTASPGTSVTFCVVKELEVTDETERFTRNLDGELYERDTQNRDSLRVAAEFYPTSITQTSLNILWDWWYYHEEVILTDGAATTPEDDTADAYFKTYTGYILEMPGRGMSPNKSGGAPWRLVIGVNLTARLTI